MNAVTPDSVGRRRPAQTKIPLDFILQTNEWGKTVFMCIPPGMGSTLALRDG